jgi:hypothetical protein
LPFLSSYLSGLSLNISKDMEYKGIDKKTINLATGWEKGTDDKWRYEIQNDLDKIEFDWED